MKRLKKLKDPFMGLLLIILGIYIPELVQVLWVSMVVDIRTSIVSGDSGHLVLTSSLWGFIMLIQSILILNGVIIGTKKWIKKIGNYNWLAFMGYTSIYIVTVLIIEQYFNAPLEVFSVIIAGTIAIGLVQVVPREQAYFWQEFTIYLQVFFAFVWLNIVPINTRYGFGITDIPASIKVAAIYLGSESLLNFIGYTFFFTLVLSTTMTVVLFRTAERNIAMARENYEKEVALDAIRQKAVNTRMYEEIHAITHDLKTPLVTVRGLNSLISMTANEEKVVEYTDRIDNAVTKMTDMISGFLYESSMQIMSAESIIDYVRAQIPVEHDGLDVVIEYGDDLPLIYANKVRVSRALINVIENAIIVPTRFETKIIEIHTYRKGDTLAIDIIDNGIGISRERMDRIWEIGYSTKQTTGLGLAFVKQVIENNGGEVSITSVVNKGTKVRILLPGAREIEEDEG